MSDERRRARTGAYNTVDEVTLGKTVLYADRLLPGAVAGQVGGVDGMNEALTFFIWMTGVRDDDDVGLFFGILDKYLKANECIRTVNEVRRSDGDPTITSMDEYRFNGGVIHIMYRVMDPVLLAVGGSVNDNTLIDANHATRAMVSRGMSGMPEPFVSVRSMCSCFKFKANVDGSASFGCNMTGLGDRKQLMAVAQTIILWKLIAFPFRLR